MESPGPFISNSRTSPWCTTKKPKGWMDTPAPLPPPNSSLGILEGMSLPPLANPKLTLLTGMMVVPSGVTMGSPMMVFTSTISRIFSMVVPMRP